MKPLLFLLLILFFIVPSVILFWLPLGQRNTRTPDHPTEKNSDKRDAFFFRLQKKASAAKQFVLQNRLSTHCVFLLDMQLPSGRKRFFVYNLDKDSVLATGLVAHGSCNNRFLETAAFSNKPGCGCSAAGRYKVGAAYSGRLGKAFKLHGLDNSNSNAYQRNIVLHAYSCVPDDECYPYPICNSLGCAMVSCKFLTLLDRFIEKEKKPLLLWIYE